MLRCGALRFAGLAAALLCSFEARASECNGRQDALGTSRVMKVSAQSGPVGFVSYKKSLDLADREVVLTFDDGPMPKRTPAVLQALAAECVKATFFVVGSMAAANPEILRKVADEGHTIGTHTWSHAYLNRRRVAHSRASQIAGGLQAAHQVLGPDQRAQLSPFFRFPGLGHTKGLDQFVAKHGLMSMSIDVDSDDWRKISSEEVLARVMRRLEARGRGIVLMHDIQAKTVAILPEMLRQLRDKGYKIVHLAPDAGETRFALASLEAPKTKSFQLAMARAQQKLVVLTALARGPASKVDPALVILASSVDSPVKIDLRGSI